MPNVSYSNRKLVVAFSPDFVVQSAHDVPIPAADLDAFHPQTTPAFHAIVPFREETRDCTGEFIIIEELTGAIARFTIGFDVTARLAAGWFAYLQGVAAAAVGTPANEVQTIALGGATGGTVTFNLDYEGISGPSVPLTVGATTTAAQVQANLETARAVKRGNVAVTGPAGGPFDVEFVEGLGNVNLPLITVDDDSTGGTGVVIGADTNGEYALHEITRDPDETPVLFSLIEGFDGETLGAKRYKNLVMNEWTITGTRRGKVTLTITAFGDPIGEVLPDYIFPECVTQSPVRTRDVRVKVGADWITSDLREFTYTESNNIDTSEDAFRFDDITPDRLERGDRTASLNILSLGSPTSAMYAFAAAEDSAFEAVELHIGRPGERLTIFAPNTQFRLDDSLIEFVGTRNKSAFRLLGRPSPDGTGVVSYGEYRGGNTTQFLLTP